MIGAWRPKAGEEKVPLTAQDIYLRIGAAGLAIIIAAASTYFYMRTATVVGDFLSLPTPKPHRDTGGVLFIKPIPATPDQPKKPK